MPLFYKFICDNCGCQITTDRLINHCYNCNEKELFSLHNKMMIEPNKIENEIVDEEALARKMSAFSEKVVSHIERLNIDFTAADLALHFNVLSTQVVPALKSLVRQGKIKPVGKPTRGRPTVYRRVDDQFDNKIMEEMEDEQ